MTRLILLALVVALTTISCSRLSALHRVFFVDAVNGNDSNSGLSPGAAWQSLGKVNATVFQPGDEIMLKRGDQWNGQLHPQGSGATGMPITLTSYGTGTLPIVNGGSLASGAAVLLYDQSHWIIEDLKVTNNSGTNNLGTATTGGVARYGILVEADTVETDITVRDNDVYDVNGAFNLTSMDPHINGGISVHALGEKGRFIGIKIQNNTVDHCGRVGIVAWQDRYYFYNNTVLDPNIMGSGLLIAGNQVSNSDGDGILVYGFDGSMVEHNVNLNAGLASIPGYTMDSSAGIWSTRSANTTIQYNESSGCRTNGTDGQGFDVDIGNENTVVQYNYSHGNQGGFLLLMGGYNSNVTVRYNISVDEGTAKGVFTLSWGTPSGLSIYNNTVYIGSGDGAVNPIYQDGAAAPVDFSFENNIIYNLGTGGYYLPTVNGIRYGTFKDNLFYGNHPSSEPADPYKTTADPMFVAPGTSGAGINSVAGYKLQPGSPAIGSGLLITDNGGHDFWGDFVSAKAYPNLGADN